MATAEPAGPGRSGHAGRRWIWAGLAVVLVGGLGLRLWGVNQGLPYAYNADEADHFVPHAVEMFRLGTLNPHYFANPPAFTYLLHVVYWLYYGGAHAVVHAYALHPGDLYTLARIAAALLGVVALWLLYLTGARLLGRGAALLAAAIEAVAFLPVFYAHLALNDAPTLAPLTLSLLGTAGVLRKGRLRDHLLAGIGLGLACATKYTAGIAVVPYAVAVAARVLDGGERNAWRALSGIVVLAAASLGAFLVANPYALLDFSTFHAELVHQSAQSAESQGKLGSSHQGGLLYYLWSLTWGLGWVPALASLAGAITIWRRERALGWLLVPAALLFLAFMGLQGRYFGRWVMPILPVLCLLASASAVQLIANVRARGRRGPRLALALTGLLVVVLLGQGLLYSVHSGRVLSRTDTRTVTREWMLANIPAGANVVVEPVSPDGWAREPEGVAGACRGATANYRWCKWPSLFSFITATGAVEPAQRYELGIEDYVRTLSPALIGYYERRDYCWVVTGSTEAGRAFADPGAVPLALAYYRALASQGEVVFRASPYPHGSGPVAFGFDWSFDYYPLAYHRPGPSMTVYRLHGGRCGA